MAENLTKKTTKGVVWSLIEKFSTLGVNILCTAIVARFLSPSDFGVVGLLVVFTTIGQTFVDGGFRSALIRDKETSEQDYSSVFFFNLAIGILVYVVLFAFSKPIAAFYNVPILEDVCKITFLTIPISALCLVQFAILTKAMNFRKIAIITFLSSVLSGIVGIALAYFTRNVWALVIQNCSLYVFRSIFVWISTKWRPLWAFSWESIKKYLGFSLNVLGAHLVGNIFGNLTSLVIGKFYTTNDLGYYTQASKLSHTSADNVTSVIRSVTYPALLRKSGTDKELKDAYKKTIKCTVLCVAFFTLMLAGISEEVIKILYGDGWEDAAKYFTILCFVGSLYPLHSVNQNILMLKGKSNKVLWLELTRRMIMIVLIYTAVHFEVIYMVWALLLYSIILLFVNLPVCGSPIHYGMMEQIADVAPIYFSTYLMFTCEYFIPLGITNPVLSLMERVLVGVVVFIATSFLVCKPTMFMMLDIVKALKRK